MQKAPNRDITNTFCAATTKLKYKVSMAEFCDYTNSCYPDNDFDKAGNLSNLTI